MAIAIKDVTATSTTSFRIYYDQGTLPSPPDTWEDQVFVSTNYSHNFAEPPYKRVATITTVIDHVDITDLEPGKLYFFLINRVINGSYADGIDYNNYRTGYTYEDAIVLPKPEVSTFVEDWNKSKEDLFRFWQAGAENTVYGQRSSQFELHEADTVMGGPFLRMSDKGWGCVTSRNLWDLRYPIQCKFKIRVANLENTLMKIQWIGFCFYTGEGDYFGVEGIDTGYDTQLPQLISDEGGEYWTAGNVFGPWGEVTQGVFGPKPYAFTVYDQGQPREGWPGIVREGNYDTHDQNWSDFPVGIDQCKTIVVNYTPAIEGENSTNQGTISWHYEGEAKTLSMGVWSRNGTGPHAIYIMAALGDHYGNGFVDIGRVEVTGVPIYSNIQQFGLPFLKRDNMITYKTSGDNPWTAGERSMQRWVDGLGGIGPRDNTATAFNSIPGFGTVTIETPKLYVPDGYKFNKLIISNGTPYGPLRNMTVKAYRKDGTTLIPDLEIPGNSTGFSTQLATHTSFIETNGQTKDYNVARNTIDLSNVTEQPIVVKCYLEALRDESNTGATYSNGGPMLKEITVTCKAGSIGGTPLPPKPTNITKTASTPTSVQLAFDVNGGSTPVSYKVYRNGVLYTTVTG